MEIRKRSIIPLEITKLALGGQGIAKIVENGQQLVAFVNKGIPGDKVNAFVYKAKKNFLEADINELVSPSPLRIKAKCEHFGQCGGCTWQNLEYEEQLKFKQSQVLETLTHLGKLKDFEFLEIKGCKDPWFYRNKMDFTFGENRDRMLALGLHLPKKFYEILPINNCYLLSEESDVIRKKVFEFCSKRNMTFYESPYRDGLLRNLMIREGKNTNEIMVNLIISNPQFNFKKELVDELLSLNDAFKNKKITSIYLTVISAVKGSKTKISEELLYGNNRLNEKMFVDEFTLNFQIHPQSFFQTNTLQGQILYEEILKFAKPKKSDIIYDLYCGTGTIGLFLAKTAKKVYGIEINEDAIRDAKENAKINQIDNIEFISGDAGYAVTQIKEKADVIVVDPPRVGLTNELVEFLIQLQTRKIVYVSCNPATMARDISILVEGGYKLKTVQPVDMFPHIYHIEVVALLEL